MGPILTRTEIPWITAVPELDGAPRRFVRQPDLTYPTLSVNQPGGPQLAPHHSAGADHRCFEKTWEDTLGGEPGLGEQARGSGVLRVIPVDRLYPAHSLG